MADTHAAHSETSQIGQDSTQAGEQGSIRCQVLVTPKARPGFAVHPTRSSARLAAGPDRAVWVAVANAVEQDGDDGRLPYCSGWGRRHRLARGRARDG